MSLRAFEVEQHSRLLRSLRIGRWFSERGAVKVSLLLDLLNRIVFGSDIPSRCPIPDGVLFMHNGLGTVVDETVRFLGEALVYQRVTLGYSVTGAAGTPVIGHRVIIGTGATVVGPIVVGDGALIGAGAVVSVDVPPEHKAIGNPAVISPINSDRLRKVWEK